MLRLIFALIVTLPLPGALLKNLDEAKALAAKEGREIYLVFTNLKNSGACVQLEKRILSQGEFQNAVADRFLVVHLDVSPDEEEEVILPLVGNRVLAQAFQVDAFPSAYFFTPGGVIYDRESKGLTGGPAEYAGRLLKKSSDHAARLGALEEAYQEDGLDRAKAIIAAMRNLPVGADPALFAGHLAELEKLDPDDSLDFRKKRLADQGFRDLDRALEEVFHKDSYGEVVKLVDAYVAKFEPKGALRQKALFPKLAALNHGGKVAEAIEAAGDIIAVDASSSYGKLAAQILKRLKSQ